MPPLAIMIGLMRSMLHDGSTTTPVEVRPQPKLAAMAPARPTAPTPPLKPVGGFSIVNPDKTMALLVPEGTERDLSRYFAGIPS